MTGSTFSRSHWRPWVVFAGALILLSAGIHYIIGLTAILNGGFFVAANENLMAYSIVTWGWIYMAIATFYAFVGYGVIVDQSWARVAAILLVGLSMIVNLMFSPVYMYWTIIALTIQACTAYALIMYGRTPPG